MKTTGILKTALSAICLLTMLAAATSANATTITLNVGLTDPYALGDVIGGLTGNGGQAARDALMVNNLLTVSVGTTSTTVPGDIGDAYQRSSLVFSPLPAATTVGSVATPQGSINFGTGTF